MKDCTDPCLEYRPVNRPDWVCTNCDWSGSVGGLVRRYRTIFSLSHDGVEIEPYASCPKCKSEDLELQAETTTNYLISG